MIYSLRGYKHVQLTKFNLIKSLFVSSTAHIFLEQLTTFKLCTEYFSSNIIIFVSQYYTQRKWAHKIEIRQGCCHKKRKKLLIISTIFFYVFCFIGLSINEKWVIVFLNSFWSFRTHERCFYEHLVVSGLWNVLWMHFSLFKIFDVFSCCRVQVYVSILYIIL